MIATAIIITLLAVAGIEAVALLHWFYMECTASTRSRRWRRNAA